MRAFTPSERRGAVLVALLLALGAVRDLVVARLGLPEDPVGAEWTEPLSPPRSAAPPLASPPRNPPTTQPLDLNHATLEDLDRLPGIGPVLAHRILEHRERHGPFGSPEELRAVRGVGPALLERLRDRVAASAQGGVQSARTAPRGAADSAQVDLAPDR